MLIPLVSAEELNDYNEIDVSVNIMADLDATDNSDIKDLEAVLNFYPRNYDFQTVIDSNLFTKPEAKITESLDDIKYKWNTVVQVVKSKISNNIRTVWF